MKRGTPAYQVSDIQRARMLKAASDALGEFGYARMTVAKITSRARVSSKTFYEEFADREDCFLALFEQTLAQAAAVAGGAYVGERQWRARIRSALGSLLVLMEREPALARLWVVEAVRGGESVLARRAQTLELLANLIDDGRSERDGGEGPPGVVAEGLVGGVVAILHTRITQAPREPLTDLLGPLMYMIVLPYLGKRAARKELAGPPPPGTSPGAASVRVITDDPLKGLEMRLTQRTGLVLLAIGTRPGASNREVAEAAGIVDQGQMSKMLTRLAGLDLIENHRMAHEQRAANSWRLTERGRQVMSVARVSAHALV